MMAELQAFEHLNEDGKAASVKVGFDHFDGPGLRAPLFGLLEAGSNPCMRLRPICVVSMNDLQRNHKARDVYVMRSGGSHDASSL